MPTTAHGAPYPSGLDGRAVPADVMALAEWVDVHTTLSATDSADRDARYSDLPAGQLVTTSAAPWFVWLKAGAGNTWVTLYSGTGWLDNAFTVTGPFDLAGQWFGVFNGQADLQLRLTYTGTDIPAQPIGNIINVEVGYIASSYGPKDFASCTTAHTGRMATFGMVVGGRLLLSATTADNVIANGESFTVQGHWTVG